MMIDIDIVFHLPLEMEFKELLQVEVLTMQLLTQGAVFFIIFGLLWYVVRSKNIFGLGAGIKGGKEAVLNALLTSCLATVVFVAMLYFTSL
jgi:hypothetical protein